MADEPVKLADLVYAAIDGVELRVDIHLPAPSTRRGDKIPVVLYLPGGGWRNCDKSKTPAPAWLLPRGIALAAVEYRRTPRFIAPQNVYDCKAAVRWVRANAGRFGFDPARVGVWGSSAGGHLAAMLAATSHHGALDGLDIHPAHADQSSAVNAACDFCGPTDLTRYANPGFRVSWSGLCGVVEAYLGGDPAERLELARLVSPLHQVTPRHRPILIVHGDVDNVVPPIESVEYAAALEKAGVDATLRIARGIGHSVFSLPSHQYVADFFERAFA